MEYPEPGLKPVYPEFSVGRRENAGQERVIGVLDVSPAGDLGEVSVDPDLSETGDPYGYAAQDPVNLTDPTGNRPKGIGHIFWIGQGFTWAQGEAFISTFLCGDAAFEVGYSCVKHLSLQTALGGRVVDIWVGDNGAAAGWINEVKTGYQANKGLVLQANKDDWLPNAGGGWTGGARGYRKFFHADNGTWWFLPSETTKLSGSSASFYQKLSNDGENIMLFLYRKGQNDRQYQDKTAGDYAMWDAAIANWTPVPRVYQYYPPANIAVCPPGNFWVLAA